MLHTYYYIFQTKHIVINEVSNKMSFHIERLLKKLTLLILIWFMELSIEI